jgi:prevent-host-death family protein
LYNFMSGGVSMQQVNIHEVRENLAEYLAAAERGEEVLICRRNQPVARLVAIEAAPARKPRPIGKAADAGVPVPASFFEPMPAGWAAAFEQPLSSAAPAKSARQPAAKPAAKRGVKPVAKRAPAKSPVAGRVRR